MSIIINNIEQNTQEWLMLRCGIPTCSKFHEIITSKGKRSATYEKYVREKAAERISGEPTKTYTNSYMKKGHEREGESRKMYSFMNDVEVVKIAFWYFDDKKEFGGSPDGLIGKSGIWENKNAEGVIQMSRIDNGWNDSEHFVQCQGNLFVGEREWCDLTSYSRGFMPVTKRIYRDESFIKSLKIELKLFNEDVQKLVEKYKI